VTGAFIISASHCVERPNKRLNQIHFSSRTFSLGACGHCGGVFAKDVADNFVERLGLYRLLNEVNAHLFGEQPICCPDNRPRRPL